MNIFIPDGVSREDAFRRTKNLAIAAHQDDVEIMATHGIIEAKRTAQRSFGAIILTDGRGSSRIGKYQSCCDEEMAVIRKEEQEKAAVLGEYSFVIQLPFTSQEIKSAPIKAKKILDELLIELNLSRVYTHNPADKHETHIAVLMLAIKSLQELPEEKRPKEAFGCEVWRSLDWMADTEKVLLDLSNEEDFIRKLISVFDSQIGGGKNYAEATIGRMKSNATFFESHDGDQKSLVWYAMDLSPLMLDPSLDVITLVSKKIENLSCDVFEKIKRFN